MYSRTIFSALVLATAALAGCGEIGQSLVAPFSGRTYSPRSYAARECWNSIEKSHAEMNLDKRADIVNKCIDDKMKGQNP